MAISSEFKVMTETIKDCDVMPQSFVCTGGWLLGISRIEMVVCTITLCFSAASSRVKWWGCRANDASWVETGVWSGSLDMVGTFCYEWSLTPEGG